MTPTQTTVLTLTVVAPANGGFCVARDQDRVVFVRYALPGETVEVRIDDANPQAKFWRGDAIRVIEPSKFRVESAWPEAGPQGIGATLWAHADLEYQRELKTEVLRDLFSRARVPFDVSDVQVQAAPGEVDGWYWRTRMHFAVENGRAGMHPARSHEVHDAGACPLAVFPIGALELGSLDFGDAEALDIAAANTGELQIVITGGTRPKVPAAWHGRDDIQVLWNGPDGVSSLQGGRVLRESVGDHEYEVSDHGFWQVHYAAPQTLSERVLALGNIAPTDRVFDLYCGVGLFAGQVAQQAASVVAVELGETALADATRNLERHTNVVTVQASTEAFLGLTQQAASKRGKYHRKSTYVRGDMHEQCDERPNLVVLDPPRTGAGTAVVRQLCELSPERIVYVSCDPATLARDLVAFAEGGYQITTVEAYDFFPNTHHMECVVALQLGTSA